MSTLDRARAKFEFWYSDEGRSPKAVERAPAGNYVLQQAQSAWQAFLAGWLEAIHAREGCAPDEAPDKG